LIFLLIDQSTTDIKSCVGNKPTTAASVKL